MTTDSAILLMYAAQRYLLAGLVDKCSLYLTGNLTVDDACSIMDHSLILGDTSLKESCVKFICANVEAVVATEGFLALSSNALEILVGDDEFEFQSENECDVHDACIAWGKNQLKKELAYPSFEEH